MATTLLNCVEDMAFLLNSFTDGKRGFSQVEEKVYVNRQGETNTRIIIYNVAMDFHPWIRNN